MEMVKIIKAAAKLRGDEDDIEMSAMTAAHLSLRKNGLLASFIETGTDGKPAYIVSLWRSTTYDSGPLPRGMRYAYLPKPVFEELSNPDIKIFK
jgi:hypothetical protein